MTSGVPGNAGQLPFAVVDEAVPAGPFVGSARVGTGEVAGFVVGGDDEQGFVPVAVLLHPVDDGCDGVDEVQLFLNEAAQLIAVTGPINGAALDHEEEAPGIVIEYVQRRPGHFIETGHGG